MKKTLISAVSISAILATQSASALDILLTNDDSWNTANIQTLFDTLQNAGHNVIMSAPCTGQSGKGGAVNFLKEVPVDTSEADIHQYCVGQTDSTLPFKGYVEGTPVMALMYGLDVVAPTTWGKSPDLVISGPNEGHNLGYLTNHSGTVGNINFAIARGIPAIAVSASHKDTSEEHAQLVADVVIDIVDQLESKQEPGDPLLPKFTGLNVNTPEDMLNHNGYLFTQVGWNPGEFTVKFVGDMSTESYSMEFVGQKLINEHPAFEHATLEQATAFATGTFAGKAGVVLTDDELTDDHNKRSEGVVIEGNYITISVVDGSLQANKQKTALTQAKLNGLVR
jgi:5'-nucleotidase